jgi:hypothetical protein
LDGKPMVLTTFDLGPDLSRALEEAAERRGAAASDLARDLIAFGLRAHPPGYAPEARALSDEERQQRSALLSKLRATRAMTLAPLQFDSTLAIREARDFE